MGLRDLRLVCGGLKSESEGGVVRPIDPGYRSKWGFIV